MSSSSAVCGCCRQALPNCADRDCDFRQQLFRQGLRSSILAALFTDRAHQQPIRISRRHYEWYLIHRRSPQEERFASYSHPAKLPRHTIDRCERGLRHAAMFRELSTIDERRRHVLGVYHVNEQYLCCASPCLLNGMEQQVLLIGKVGDGKYNCGCTPSARQLRWQRKACVPSTFEH